MDDMPDLSTDDMEFDESYHRELMNFLSESHMRDTAKGSIKQSLYAASGAFVGSFIGGPVGGLLGGVAGSVAGYFQSDDYDGVIVALAQLEKERQKTLVMEVYAVLKPFGATFQSMQNSDAFRETLHEFAKRDGVRNGIWNACLHSIRS
mmetsp:Transcript_20110/g.29398  ORF Transcript_20110/g.29398 Transcript_20110/m.29398 type:complete len:149 (+) Transcript_20110:110-556(+)|eukprot:CAMPEP_0197233376 /NCGR_PEP_ID=MMETSP1429-20130617/1443_1 /TAXON_ID=49237 /ORGANISM="Chaetoceros  sp., Strain UNC1202" /LENGTH=148 /DNA_ID=CAMNT_0042691603 /DNA_START=110 /DNA_END=556 /DNA_ORIENTATION=-